MRRPRRGTDNGFTLVELLVVVVVVAILAAIAVPVFIGQRKKAADAALQTDLRTLALSEETYYTDHDAYLRFSATNRPVVVDPIVLSKGVSASVELSSSGQAYCIRASSDGSSGPRVHISSRGGLQPSTTTTCPLGSLY